MLKSFELQHYSNLSKQNKIKDIFKEYRITSNQIANAQWRLFYTQGKFNKNLPIKQLKSSLTERYKQTCQYQVVGILNSYFSNIQNKIKTYIYNSSLPEETKIILFTINKYNLYYKPNAQIKKQPINSGILKLARRILKHELSNNRKPTTKNINLSLDNKVAIIKSKEKDKAKHFDYWIQLSALTKHKLIQIPIKTSQYYESIKGERKNFLQIVQKENEFEFRFIKETKVEYIPIKGSKVAIDIGLNNLIATEFGDLLGRNLLKYLEHYDKILTQLDANNRNKKLDVKSKKHNAIVSKIKNHLKHIVNLSFQKLLELYSPEEIIVEKLDFSSSTMSKSINRLIQNFGKGLISNKLKQLEEFGIIITEVHPAYSSKTCSSCGYVDPNQRHGNEFECKLCKRKIHADVNASRNHRLRSSQLKYKNIYKRVKEVLEEVIVDFFEQCPNALRSRAQELIVDNKYFLQSKSKGFS